MSTLDELMKDAIRRKEYRENKYLESMAELKGMEKLGFAREDLERAQRSVESWHAEVNLIDARIVGLEIMINDERG